MPKKLLIPLVAVVFSFVFFAGITTQAIADGESCGISGQGVCINTPGCQREGRTNISGTCPKTTGGSTQLCCSPEVTDPFGVSSSIKNQIPEVEEYVEGVNEVQLKDGSTTNKQYFDYLSTNNLQVAIVDNLAGAGTVDSNGDPTNALIPSMTNMIATIYNQPPATTDKYIADVLQDANIVPQAYAQGLGFASLTPILSTWKIFRNISYFFFIIIFLAIGFMIMFRSKIGGQTAVTAQQAIPRVIVSLLAVTFSYAIAGLLIDVMYLMMYLLVGLFSESQDLIQSNIFSIGSDVIGRAAGDTYDAISSFVTALFDDGGGVISGGLGMFGGLTAAVIIVISLAIAIFRLFFELLKTYITIIISIALAPFTLMMGAIPGKNTFGPWVKGLVGNLSAFPIVLVVLIIYRKISDAAIDNNGGFLPPYLIGSGQGENLAVLIGLGILMLATDLVKEGKKAFGATGGIFEQFTGALADTVKRGWTGGELIPGVAATDTSKWPMGGLSGKNLLRKGGTITGGAAGGGTGFVTSGLGAVANRGLYTLTRGRRGGLDNAPLETGWLGAKRGARRVADLTDDPWLKKDREARKEGKKGYTD